MSNDEHPIAALATLAEPTIATPARQTQLSLATDPDTAPNAPLPHQPWTTRLPQPVRVVAHGWWKVFFFLFVGNYLAALVFSFLQGGWSALVMTLSSWGFLAPLERTQPLAF
ncbi:MAG: hypothetical protein ABI068_14110 [Ktedonobacterales bacterium]